MYMKKFLELTILLALLSSNSVAIARREIKENEAVKISAIDYPSLISKADLIYTNPVKNSFEGQPVGNGRMILKNRFPTS